MTSSSSMTIITPKPSVIFSTTSSSSSIRSCCGDDDNGNGSGNVGEEGEFDGQEDEQIGLYVDDSAGNDDDDDDEQKITTLFSSSTTTPSTTTTATSTTKDEAQIHKLTTMQTTTRKIMTALMMNISKRILQLFMIHFFVYISITVYYQSTNRLLMKDIIGSSNSGGLISSSSILTSNTNTNSNTTLFNDININNDNDNDNNSSIDHQDCYYVPGGGFSGYWFLLGRLQKMKRHQNNMNDKKFVCYSSGCLGVIATLLMNDNDNNNNNVDSIYNMARTIQMEWNEGRLHQYQVVESFIDGLLSPVLDKKNNNDKEQQQQEEAFLETIRNNLYIITSTYDDNSDNSSTSMLSSIIPTAIIQQPTNIHELKHLLLQTAWIPFVTGSSWTYKNQMDGAFSTFQHPKCHTNIELIVPDIIIPSILPSILLTTATATAVETDTETKTETETKPSITIIQALKLWTNILNVNLKKNDVDILWKMGFDYGV